MVSHSTRHGRRIIGPLALFLFAAAGVVSPSAFAQEKKDAGKEDSVFDEDKSTPAKTKGADAAKPPGVSDRDTIGFSQQNAASQMNELEERMFRLSEALRGLEPENASRLRLALQFSREEQILEQMRETHKLLKEAQLTKAETEVKELIAKLQHLRNLLLAEDLDFQLKLARLRQMRETLGQLERIIVEEKRELGWSRFALAERKRLDRFTTRQPDLDALLRDQQALIADTKKTSGNTDQTARDACAAIRDRESKLRSAAAGLATDPMFADLQPPHLRRADSPFADAVKSLEGTDLTAALAAEEKALGLLREELNRLNDQMGQTQKTVGEPEFRRRAGDQAKNQAAAEALSESSARLGDVGVALRKELIHSGAAMKSAEERLGKSAAAPAAEQQSTAARDPRHGSRRIERFHRAAARRAAHRAPGPARHGADRDARLPDGNSRNDPGAGPAGLAEVAHGAAHRGRPVQERGRDRRADRALARPGRGDRVRHCPANHTSHLFARCERSRAGSSPTTSPPARSGSRPGSRKTCWHSFRRSAGCRPQPRRRPARPSPPT